MERCMVLLWRCDGFNTWQIQVTITVVILTTYGNLGQLLNMPKHHFISYGYLCRLKDIYKIKFIEHFAQCLAHGKHSTNRGTKNKISLLNYCEWTHFPTFWHVSTSHLMWITKRKIDSSTKTKGNSIPRKQLFQLGLELNCHVIQGPALLLTGVRGKRRKWQLLLAPLTGESTRASWLLSSSRSPGKIKVPWPGNTGPSSGINSTVSNF